MQKGFIKSLNNLHRKQANLKRCGLYICSLIINRAAYGV